MSVSNPTDEQRYQYILSCLKHQASRLAVQALIWNCSNKKEFNKAIDEAIKRMNEG